MADLKNIKLLTESMHRFEVGSPEPKIIRCWREEDPNYDQDESRDEIMQQIRAIGSDDTPKEIALRLILVDRMNAVEVVNRNGNGVVVYANWP